MRMLLDSCVSGKLLGPMGSAGHDVAWVGDWERDPGDEEILGRAHEDGRILVTLDKDFGELAVVRGMPHSGIVRLAGLSLKDHAAVCLEVLELHGAELEAGAIVTAEPGRLRVRPPEEPEQASSAPPPRQVPCGRARYLPGKRNPYAVAVLI